MIKELLLIGLLLACSGDPNTELNDHLTPKQLRSNRPDAFVDPALQSLVDQYRKDMTAAGLIPVHATLRVERGDMTEMAGFCQGFGLVRPAKGEPDTWWIVVIRRDISPDSTLARTVMYHELTHCDYGIDHSTKPFTIMYPMIGGTNDYWTSTWPERVAELAENIKTSLEAK